MTAPRLFHAGLVALAVSAGVTLSAHVRATPRESPLGGTETYTFRVPSERGLRTTSVVLDVPDGVTVLSVTAPDGATHAEATAAGRIVQVTWTIEIAPDAVAQLTLVARNPARGESIIWKVHQKYSDGSVSDWVGAEGTPNPAPFTTLVPADVK